MMAYFKINDVDFSTFVKSLKVSKTTNYNAQVNAAGDTVVDYINFKRVIEVGIIPMSDTNMATLLQAIEPFNVSISFRNPDTNLLEEIDCIIPSTDIEYYTIQINKISYKECVLKFTEL